MEPKLLKFFDNEINAQEIKVKLNEAAIECVLQNELKTSINVMSGSAEEGVALYVDKKDYPESKKILDSYEQELEEKLKWCPECDSDDVTITTELVKYKPRWLFIFCIAVFVICIILSICIEGWIFIPGLLPVIGLIVMIVGYDKKVYHCNKCGNDF
ncbi:MAG: DUF2007 domain-containing protein [Muribaculaceae bacterium]|nr:DUF2007 domain-containing protein [Muribaculaceae bacterium]